MTPEDRIRMARSGATIQPPLTVEDAEARYRAAGMDPVAARTVAQGEARIHGAGAQDIWAQSPSAESIGRVQGVRGRQAAVDRQAQEAAAEPYQGRGLPLLGEPAEAPKPRTGPQGALAYRDQKAAEAGDRMKANVQFLNETDARDKAKRQAIAALPPAQRAAYEDQQATKNAIPNLIDRRNRIIARWQREGADWKKNGGTFEQFVDDHDANFGGSGLDRISDPRLRSAWLNKESRLMADAEAARRNHETGRQRAKDYNLARETGRPIGDVMFQNDLMNQQGNPDGQAAVLMGQDASRPGHGFGNAGVIVLKGKQDLAAVQAAGGNQQPSTPGLKIRQDLDNAMAAPIGQRLVLVRGVHQGTLPANQPVDEASLAQRTLNTTGGEARAIAMRHGDPNSPPSPEEEQFLRDWTRMALSTAPPHQSGYEKYLHWCQQIGVDPEDPASRVRFQKASGVNPTPTRIESFSNWWNGRGGGSRPGGPPSAVASPPQAGAAPPSPDRGDL